MESRTLQSDVESTNSNERLIKAAETNVERKRDSEFARPTLNVFLCHSSDDKVVVRELHDRLATEGVRPWLDQNEILPGHDWNMEITKAVRNSHVVIVCLSARSITKAGYVQKEIKQALDVADEQPEGTIFIIPLRLEECQVPERLRRWQWVDYFDPNGYGRLVKALRNRASAIAGDLTRRSTDPPVYEPNAQSIAEEPPRVRESSPQRAAKKLSETLARAQRNREVQKNQESLEVRLARSARLTGPQEFEKMQQFFEERAHDFNKSNKPDSVPDISYDSKRHLLDAKKFAVSIDILMGQVYELRIFIGYHPDAVQFMSEMPEVQVTRWRLRASEDENGFYWHEMNEHAKFSSEEIVDASIDALTDLLAADM